MLTGNRQFLHILFLVGLSMGLLAMHVQAYHADSGHPALETYGPHLSARYNELENSSPMDPLQLLPFAALAITIVALSAYALYHDRSRKRQALGLH